MEKHFQVEGCWQCPRIRMKEKQGGRKTIKKTVGVTILCLLNPGLLSSKGLPNPRNTDVPHPFIFSPTFQNSPSKKDMVKAFFSRNSYCKCCFFILTNRQGTCTTNLNSSLLIIPLLSESNAWKVCRPRCSIKLWSRWLRTHPPLAAWQ